MKAGDPGDKPGGVSRNELEPRMAPEQQTIRVIYTGHVQGVGFRASTKAIAKRYPVTGYVRNLPDRTVELVMRGTDADLQQILDAVQSTFKHNITNTNKTMAMIDELPDAFKIL